MPGIRAAFIDVGMEQDAFLHFSDIGSISGFNALFEDDEDDKEGVVEEAPVQKPAGEIQNGERGGVSRDVPDDGGNRHGRQQKQRYSGQNIPQANLKKGQDILVQVTKEPVGKKGVRVRSAVSLPGRFLVLIPFDGKVGVSKKLANFKEKRRLRRTVRAMLPAGFGAIIRTVAEGKTDEMLKQDLDELVKTWQKIEKTVKAERAPALIYKDMNTTSSVIRDLFQDAVEHVVVDNKKLLREIRAYVQWMSPDMLDRVEYYRESEPIFDKYGIEKEIQILLSKKVWLKSGGYLFIEKTEAMTVIDVNSGRYAAKKEQELNSLRTNLEAAREACRQIRLRDVGGLIVVDFIDLEDEKNKKKIYDEMKKELRKDRAKVTVLPLTEFGLMQLTRQRIRQTVQLSFSEACPMCGGTGLVQSKTSTMNHIERWIKRFKAEKREYRLELRINPIIAEYLSHGTISRLMRMQLKFFVKIKLISDPALAADEFKFFSVKQQKEVTEEFK
jgi:ribonuclease G